MTFWLKDVAAGAGLVVFIACSFVLAHAAQVLIAAG